jgi:NADPH:quinone reductase
VLGAVSCLAAQLAAWSGAIVIGSIRQGSDLEGVDEAVMHSIALDQGDPVVAVRRVAPDGVDCIVEVSFSDNVDLDVAVGAAGAVIAAYATRDPGPDFDFWPMLCANLTICLLGSDDFSREAKQQAAADLTAAARERALRIPIDERLPLQRVAEAHDRVDVGARGRVLLTIPQDS